MGGAGGVGPGVTSSGVSCLSLAGDRRVELSSLAQAWTHQQEMIGMFNLSDRVVPHVELKSGATYV